MSESKSGAPTGAPEESSYDTGALAVFPTGELLLLHRSEPAGEPVDPGRIFSLIAASLGVLGLVGSLFLVWAAPLSIGAVIFGRLGLIQGGNRRAALTGVIAGSMGIGCTAVWVSYYIYLFL